MRSQKEAGAVNHRYALRRAGLADIESCLVLARQAAPDRRTAEWRQALRRDVECPEHELVVAETDGMVIGYGRARLYEPGPHAPADAVSRGYYLTGVYVRPDRRREGVAAALTRERLIWIAERADEAWFFVNARNTPSIELHRRFGFEEIRRRFSFPGLTFEGGEGILFRLRGVRGFTPRA